jgi:tRNA A-37 threonylcarbamoyl transferase component Bud32/tetratricopeptide (TPR) repeat protein
VGDPADRLAEPEIGGLAGGDQRIAAPADHPESMLADTHAASTAPESTGARELDGPGLDSIDDALMRQRIHASLFASERAGVWVDRFELLEKLGAGGMGTVWAAQDHRLQRRVALKFLRSQLDGSTSELRLFREAQALARMQHPNVIAVYDVGRHEGRVWIAMELVPGKTLREWVGERERPSAEILEVWLAAGRGLAAIHAAGLVHRDIKPDNVLLGDDGRVRVIDFGLVRAIGATTAPSTERSGPDTRSSDDVVDQLITRTQQFVGTPSYAAPEQVGRGFVDARTDQYSFCVALWEALTGKRPKLDDRPGVNKLSARVRGALLRGLGEDPADRFENMSALLAALEPPRRRWVLSAALGVALVAALGAGVGGAFERDEVVEPVEPCANAGAAIDEQWNADAEQRVRAAFAGKSALAEFAVAGVEQWTSSWRDVAREACEQVHVRQLASPESLDRRASCLDEQRRELDTILEVLASEGTTGPDLLGLLDALDAPGACLREDVDPLAGLTPEQVDAHRHLGRELVRVMTVQRNRSVAERRAELLELARDAERRGLEHLQARVAGEQGRLAWLAGDREAARAHLGSAVDRAERLGLDSLRARAWLDLANVEVDLALDPERGRWAWERAQALLGTRVSPDAELGHSYWTLGRIQLGSSDYALAERSFDEAIDEYAELGPSRALGLSAALRQRAVVAARLGRAQESERFFARARAVELLDSGEAGLAYFRGGELSDEALTKLAQGEIEAARELAARARQQLEVEFGSSLPLANAYVVASQIADTSGSLDEARSFARTADAMVRQNGEPGHFDRFYALSALGVAEFRARRFDEAGEVGVPCRQPPSTK